jgi:hypothetical protein
MKTKNLKMCFYRILLLNSHKSQRGETLQSSRNQSLCDWITTLILLGKDHGKVLTTFCAMASPAVGIALPFSASPVRAATLSTPILEQAGEQGAGGRERIFPSKTLIAEADFGNLPASPSSNSSKNFVPTNPEFISPISPFSTNDPLVPENSQKLPFTPTKTGQTPAVPVTSPVKSKKVKLDISPADSPQAQADGRSTIRLRGELTDENGQLVPGDVVVTLTSSAGKFVGADQNPDQGGFQVIARDGEFLATLQSDIKPQQVKIRAAVDKIRSNPKSPNGINPSPGEAFPQQNDTSIYDKLVDSPLEAYTQVEFVTFLRPSIATGIINLRIGARGTDYWGSFSDFLQPGKTGTGVDFKASAFATGKVGEWLFTGAYNSYRPLNQDCEGENRLFGGTQFCEQQYPVYGDSSTVTPTTPSIDSVYARFERSPKIPGADPDFLMWGDYNTSEFARESQLYSATSRQLHGLKLNYNFGNLQFTGMFANNIEGFQRDTFVPNGTSGNYFLSKRLLVPGSETVYVEAEEINRPGTVVERKPLYRDQDYEIDYDRGTLIFRRPFQATDLNPFGATLVRRIVVSYQNEGGKNSNLYAGRLQYNLSPTFQNRSFLAGSYLSEDQGDRNFQLYGADFLVSLGNNGRIIGEFARSTSDLDTGRGVNGNAYRLEATTKFGNNLFADAYYRGVEPNFLNNATTSYSPGQTRYGASLLAKVTDTTSLRFGYDLEENYGTAPSRVVDFFDLFNPQPQARPGEAVSNELRTFRAGVLQKLGTTTLSPELSLEYVNRSREDRVNTRFNGDASQLVSQAKVPLGESLLFRAQNELNLDGSDPLYPNRTTLGLDWKAYPGVTFALRHQFFDSSELIKGNSITTFDTLLDRKISENTAITGRYSVLSAYNGLQGQGAVGLNQKLVLSPGLRMSLGYEYVFKNLFNATAAGPRYEQYYAVGQSASSLGLFSGSVYSLGLEYTDNPNFQASGRFEYRDGDENNNLVISAAAAGKITPALTALVRYQQAGEANVYLPTDTGINSSGIRLQELGDTSNLKIGLAYRDPTNDKFNGLLKYEWRKNYDSIPETQLVGSTVTGHTFSAEGIYAPNWRWELYGKMALRNGVTFLNGDRFDGTAKLAQLRASYKLGYRTDLAVEGRWIGQDSNSNNGYNEFGLAVESGYYVTPDLRVAAGYSFGSVDVNGDRDFTGYRSEGGLYLNISLKLNELLGGFGLQKPVPKQQQESVPKPTTSQQVNSSGNSSENQQIESQPTTTPGDTPVTPETNPQPPIIPGEPTGKEETKSEILPDSGKVLNPEINASDAIQPSSSTLRDRLKQTNLLSPTEQEVGEKGEGSRERTNILLPETQVNDIQQPQVKTNLETVGNQTNQQQLIEQLKQSASTTGAKTQGVEK